MKEWEIGITDNHPSTWERVQPLWGDEKIVATSKDSFLELMTKLCETAIASRREHENDSGITDHLWKLTIKSYKDIVDTRSSLERTMMMEMGSYDESDDSDDDEQGYHGTCVIRCPQDVAFGYGGMDDEDDPQEISSDSKLDAGIFPVESIMKVCYDYGSTTELYLKVLRVKSTAVRNLLQYFTLEAKASDYINKMKKVPAYSFPKEKQIDHFFPNFSRAFLGFHVPLFKKNTTSDKKKSSKKVISSATIGLSSRICSEDDTTFCSMINRTSSSDLLFFPGRFEINELLQTGEKAWEPVDPKEDKNDLDRFRYDSIARWGIPPGDDKSYDRISKMRDEMGPWGPKMLLFQLAKEREESEFKMEQVFPKTYEMLQCGKFRWFQYKKGVLRVIVGRGVGHNHRSFESDQVLGSLKYDFESFHELLCAVEASWVWKGKQMTADTLIPKFDTDLGPSKPMPKEGTHFLCVSEKVFLIGLPVCFC